MDDQVRLFMNMSQLVFVLANDHDPNSKLDTSSVQIIRQPAFGTVTPGTYKGSFLYSPNAGFKGSDSFTYSIADDGIACEVLRDTATVTITVIAPNLPPVAVDDHYLAGCSPMVELITTE